MFDFLKNLFREPKEIKWTLKELKAAIDDAKKSEEDKTNNKIKSITCSIKHSLEELDKLAYNLEKAPIYDEEHIEPRIKTIVNSQRQFFSSQAKLMISRISFPDYINLENAKEFAGHFNEEFSVFTQKTVKSFTISNHLFHNELESIKQNLKEMDGFRINLIEVLKNEKLEILTGLLNNLNMILSKQESLTALNKQKQTIEEDQKSTLNRLEILKKSLDELKNENELVSAENNLKSAKIREKEIISSIESFFSKTERQWMKISKKYPEHNEKIRLLTKKPLEFHETYSKLFFLFEKTIKNKEIGNEDYAKITKTIDGFSPHKLSDLITELKIIQNKIQDIENGLLPNKTKIDSISKEINSLETSLDSLQKKLDLIDKELKTPKTDYNKIAEIDSGILNKKVVLDD